MRGKARVDPTTGGEETRDVATAEAVACRADFRDTVGSAEGGDGGLDDGFDFGLRVPGLPGGEVEG